MNTSIQSQLKIGDTIIVVDVIGHYPYYSLGDIGIIIAFDLLNGLYKVDLSSNKQHVGDGIWYIAEFRIKLYQEKPLSQRIEL